MISKELAEKIIAEIPSASLREAIKAQNWQFSDRDLFLIAAKYCRLLKTRWELLDEVIAQADESVSEWAKNYLEYEKRVKEKFCETDEKCVYEFCFLEKCGETVASDWENYLFKNFAKAEKFCKEYLAKHNCYIKVKMEKRLFLDDLTVDDDYLGYANFNLQGNCLSFDYYDEKEKEVKEEDCIVDEYGLKDCENCDDPCVKRVHPKFPPFFEEYDIVSYFDEYKGKSICGFVPYPNSNGEAYVVTMEGETVERYMAGLPLASEKDIKSFGGEMFYLRFQQHEHIELSEIEKVEYKDLPEKYQKIYDKLSMEFKKLYD